MGNESAFGALARLLWGDHSAAAQMGSWRRYYSASCALYARKKDSLAQVGSQRPCGHLTTSGSTSHLLGAALERRYQDVLLSDGPATEEGFYYDFATAGGKGAAPSVADLPTLVPFFEEIDPEPDAGKLNDGPGEAEAAV